MFDDSEWSETPELPLGVRLFLTVIDEVGGAVLAVLRSLPPRDPDPDPIDE